MEINNTVHLFKNGQDIKYVFSWGAEALPF